MTKRLRLLPSTAVAFATVVGLAAFWLGLTAAGGSAWQVIDSSRSVVVTKDTEAVEATFVIRNRSGRSLRVLGTRAC